jgi:pyrimidine operon attenuation protein/uracil phosphoribosyltransferase
MTEILTDVSSLLQSMAQKIAMIFAERRIDHYRIVGIRSRGVWVANALKQELGHAEAIGELDVSFYRDDFTRAGLNLRVRPSVLPFATDDCHILLVDDVLMSGRTVRVAMNELFDFGRPAGIVLAVLADIGGREFPIQADVLGCTLQLEPGERVKLTGPDPLNLVIKRGETL